jgi:ABC-type antimicrobial peptide transport system permease subunit
MKGLAIYTIVVVSLGFIGCLSSISPSTVIAQIFSILLFIPILIFAIIYLHKGEK